MFAETHVARTSARRSHVVGRDPDVLGSIAGRETNIAIWKRPLPEGLGAALSRWAERRDRDFDRVIRVESYDVGPALDGFDDEPLRRFLLDDMTLLIERFASIARISRLRISFGAVRDNSCRKFHADYLRLRLVTTYVGPGTEWLSEDVVRREALGPVYECPDEANRAIVRDATRVRRARAGEVLLMKGSLHRSGAPGVVHRSPPIEGTGRTRVVLVASTITRHR